MNKECEDKKCPVHGNVSTRGHGFEATVVSDRMQNSVVVERPYTKKIAKYQRYEKRTTRITAHNPECIKAKRGDNVVVKECRPLSKTKSFVVIEKKGHEDIEERTMPKKAEKEEKKEEVSQKE